MFVGDPHLGDCAIVSCDARFATTDGRGTHACTLDAPPKQEKRDFLPPRQPRQSGLRFRAQIVDHRLHCKLVNIAV